MADQIDGQYHILNIHVKNERLFARLEELSDSHSEPDKKRRFANMQMAAACLEGDCLNLNGNEAKKLVDAWSGNWNGITITAKNPVLRGLQSAYITGTKNRIFNVITTLRKYSEEQPVAVRAKFYRKKNVKIFFRIIKEGAKRKDLGVTEGRTDSYGVARRNFNPAELGKYRVYASTVRKDVEGDLSKVFDRVAVGQIEVVSDKPTIAIDVQGLIDKYGLEKSKDFLRQLSVNQTYNLVGITPYNDLHAQNRLKSLLHENGLDIVLLVHNSFRISDYYDTEMGRQEYLGEYVKRLASQHGLLVVAGIGFDEYTGNGFRIADPKGKEIDVFVPGKVKWKRRMKHIRNGGNLSEILSHFSEAKSIKRYQKISADNEALRNSDDYLERISWQISKLTGSGYTDGNHIEHIRDKSSKRDDNRAALYKWIDFIKSVPPGGQIVSQQFAWYSSEEGFMLAMSVADSAYRSKKFWDNNLRQKLSRLIEHAEKNGSFSDATRLREVRDRLTYIAGQDINPEYGKLVDKYISLFKKMDRLPDKPLGEIRAHFMKQREELLFQLKRKLKRQYELGLMVDVRTIAESRIANTISEISNGILAKELKSVLKYVKETPRVPIYVLPDKTSLVEYPAASGYHNGKLALSIMAISGAYVTVTNMDFGMRDKDGELDSLYHRRNPLAQVAVTKHAKTFVMEVEKNGKREWLSIGGARLPISKSFGKTHHRKKEPINEIQKLTGVPTRHFEDESYILRGPAVAELYKYTVEDIKRMRPVAEVSDDFKLVFPKKGPPTNIKAGDNRVWTLKRWPFEGVSPLSPIEYLLERNAAEKSELDIVCGFDIDKKWMAQLEQLISAGYVGTINYYTAANDFLMDSVDTKKAQMLTKLATLAKEKKIKINLYIVKAQQRDPQTGLKVSPEAADSIQLHSRFYLLRKKDEKKWIAVIGNGNLDEQSLKDQENSEVVIGPATKQLKWRLDEFRSRSICLNNVPGIVKPDAKGKYWSPEKVYNYIWKHFSKKSRGNDPMSPTSLSYWDALTGILGTFLGQIWDRIEKHDSYSARIDYTPTVIGGNGFNNYHGWSAAYRQGKYLFGMDAGLYIGFAGIGKDFLGINAGLEVDGLIVDMYGDRKPVDQKYLGLDIGFGFVISMKDALPVGFFDLKISPFNISFHANDGRTEITWKILQAGLRTHWGYLPRGIPETGFVIGTTLSFSTRPNLPLIRNGELAEPREIE